MGAAKMLGSNPRIGHFIVAFGLEADRIRGDWLPGSLRQHAGHGRAVGAATQKARRSAAVQLPCHCLCQQGSELGLQILERRIGGRLKGRHPIGLFLHLAASDYRHMAGL